MSVSLGGKGGGVTYFDYFRYDPENPTRTIAVPDLSSAHCGVCLGSEDNPRWLTLFVVRRSHLRGQRAGRCSGRILRRRLSAIDYKNDIAAVYYRHVDVPAEGATLIQGGRIQGVTVNNNSEDSRVTLLFPYSAIEMPNSEKGISPVYRSQKLSCWTAALPRCMQS